MTADVTYQPKVYLKQGGDEQVVKSGGLITVESGGQIKADADSLLVGSSGAEAALLVPVTVLYTAVTPTEGAVILGRAFQLASIYLRPQAAADTASTITFFKVPNGYGVASGTQISTGAVNLSASTANVNKVPNLTATTASITFAAGDALGYVLSAAPTSGRGSITFNLKPA